MEKNKYLKVTVTPEENESIKEFAESVGVSVSALLGAVAQYFVVSAKAGYKFGDALGGFIGDAVERYKANRSCKQNQDAYLSEIDEKDP